MKSFSRPRSNYWRPLGLLTLVCLSISIAVNEWSYTVRVPLLLSYFGKVVAASGFLVLGAASGALFLKGYPERVRLWLYLSLGLYILILISGRLLWFVSSPSPWIYVGLGQAILAGFVGCRIGQNGTTAQWTLRTIARASAVVSVYMFLTPTPRVGSVFPVIGVGWPVQLFILFGFCWYASTALMTPKLSGEMIVGILVCSLEVFVSFHKPTVIAGLGCMMSMIMMVQAVGQRRWRANYRAFAWATLLTVAILAVVEFNGGSWFESYREDFYVQYLHRNSGYEQIALDEQTLQQFSGGRFRLWDEAFEQFLQSPWVGSGPGMTFFADSSFQEIHAHNGYLELLYSIGVIGAFAHVVAACVWFRETILARGFDRRADIMVPIAAYVGGFLTFETGGGATVFHNLLTFLSLLMGIGLGYSVACAAPPVSRRFGAREVVVGPN